MRLAFIWSELLRLSLLAVFPDKGPGKHLLCFVFILFLPRAQLETSNVTCAALHIALRKTSLTKYFLALILKMSSIKIVPLRSFHLHRLYSGASTARRAAGAKPHTCRNWANQRKPCIEIGKPCFFFSWSSW